MFNDIKWTRSHDVAQKGDKDDKEPESKASSNDGGEPESAPSSNKPLATEDTNDDNKAPATECENISDEKCVFACPDANCPDDAKNWYPGEPVVDLFLT